MPDQAMTFKVENARLIFRNFEGRDGPMNAKGDRNFCVILDDEEAAAQMIEDGWNVKFLKPREDDEDGTPTPYIQVAVSYKVRPPRIQLITSTSRTRITEANVEMLDDVDIAVADLIARGRYWEVRENSGIKAYLQNMFITLEEDDLDRKYGMMEPDFDDEPEED